MGSEDSAAVSETINVAVDGSITRSCSNKRMGKVPKRIHKAEREKLKRERLNELFYDLACALEPTQQNNGKASILCEATRLLKELFSQIESLRKENASLLSESQYVTVEKNELKEENSALETQIKQLQNELEARAALSKPDLNITSPEFPQTELRPHLTDDCLGLPAVEPALAQPPTVLVMPIGPNLEAYSASNTAPALSKPASKVSKPHARYPDPADLWPSQLLRDR